MEAKRVSELVAAIPVRHSVRTFKSEPLSKQVLVGLEAFGKELLAPFAHDTQFRFFVAEPGKKLYNNGVNPPDNMAVLAQTDLVSIAKAGFVGELMMLYAVSQGLSTCWFGHYKLAELGRYIGGLASPQQLKQSTLGYGYGRGTDVGLRAICCMPVGIHDEVNKRFVDIVAGKNGAGRKPLERLMEETQMLDFATTQVRAALELARLAPSAANSQFWRFGISGDGKVVTLAKPVGYKHFKWEHPAVDVGMCAAHLWLGLLDNGLQPDVAVAMSQDRAMWTFTL